jgi:uncharacterized protein
MEKNKITHPRTHKLTRKQKNARIILFTVIGITIIHTIYMNIMGFNSLSHDACMVYQNVPKWFFYFYENVLELFIVTILGVFAGVMMEQYFHKIKRFYPKNQVLAFFYASILPICSCGVIPLIDSMKKKTSLKVIVTFVLAAPLLNPYIIFVSFSLLGLKYTILRIISSFILSITVGIFVEFIAKRFKLEELGNYEACATSCDTVVDRDPFVKTVNITKKLWIYILGAALLSFAFQFINPKTFLVSLPFYKEPYTMIVMTIIGIPMYVCNGADVLMIKPLLAYTDLSLGSGMAFSLSSSVLCVASITMLMKFLCKKLTFSLVAAVFVMTILIGTTINLINF